MTTHSTDFREYRRGRLPADFEEIWTTGSISVIEGAWCDLQHRNYLRTIGAVTGTRTGICWVTPSFDSGFANQELLGLFRVTNMPDSNRTIFILRAGGTLASSSFYHLTFDFTGSNTFALKKTVSGTTTSLANITSKPLIVGHLYHVRFGASGTTVRAKLWPDGTSEPVSWDLSVTDSAISSGKIGVSCSNAGETIEHFYLAVGTNGDSAPSETALPSPMDTWTLDPDEEIEITLRFEYFDVANSEVRELWVSSHGRNTSSVDFPSNTMMDATILDAGSIQSGLESDFHVSAYGQYQPSAIRVSNLPFDVDSSRPLSTWLRFSFFGRPVECRVGKRWSTPPTSTTRGVLNLHRRFEIIWCAVPAKEPDLTPDSAIIELGPPDTILSSVISDINHSGISTGVKAITSVGSTLIPASTSYNLNSYTIYLRVFIPAGGVSGTGGAVLTQKENGSSLRTWYLTLFHAAHPTFANLLHFSVHDSGGTNIIAGFWDATSTFGKWNSIIVGVLGGSRYYVLVNGAKVLSGNISASPRTNNGVDVKALLSSVNVIISDHRIEQFVGEDEALSRFATRATPDSLTISMHRFDDNSGSTVTDYATLANHGTLQGVDVTDRQWVASYQGSVESAGLKQQLSMGVVYNLPTQAIDPVREAFRYNDRAYNSGAAIVVRARGAVLVGGGTNYTEPLSGPGVVDIVGASDQPVTVGLDPSVSPDGGATHIARLATDEITLRNSLWRVQADIDSFLGVRRLLPIQGGVYYSEPPKVAQLLDDTLGKIACHYRLDSNGRVVAGCVLPPINPGPWGQRSLMEFFGLPNCGVTFGAKSSYSLTQTSNRFSLVAVFKCNALPIDPGTSSSFSYFPTGQVIIDGCSATNSGYYMGIDGRDGCLILGTVGLSSTILKISSRPIPSNRWVVAIGVRSGSSRTLTAYVLKEGTVTGEIDFSMSSSDSPTGSMVANTGVPIRIGHSDRGAFNGSILYAVGSSTERSLTITSNKIQEPTFNASIDRLFVSLTEGSGDLSTDVAQSNNGRLLGVRWCPKLVADMNTVAGPTLERIRTPIPANSIEVLYRRNYQPLTGADVYAAAPSDYRVALGKPYLSLPFVSADIKNNYRQSREVVIESPSLNSVGASAILSLVRQRLEPSLRFADITNWYREALRLGVGDEVLLISKDYELETGRPMRVIFVAKHLKEMVVSFTLWG